METLYHYCGNESFISIIRNRSIWLSSLKLSNDTKEGRVVIETIMRLAQKDGLDASAQDQLARGLSFLENFFDGLGFCLSSEGDLLSQWRGYADDGRGVAIGFSKEFLERRGKQIDGDKHPGFSLYKVLYEPAEQETAVTPIYEKLKELIGRGAFAFYPRGLLILASYTAEEIAAQDKEIEKATVEMHIKLLELFPFLFQLKGSAFKEERESRLVSVSVNDADGMNCQFRAKNERIIPYRNYPIHPDEEHPIAEIVLGPRHQTPIDVISSALRQSGFKDVVIKTSEATYR